MKVEELILPKSATIDYLKEIVDKVAFFYCKRDEHDRRDREKILLTLIKQLACPTITSSDSSNSVSIRMLWKLAERSRLTLMLAAISPLTIVVHL